MQKVTAIIFTLLITLLIILLPIPSLASPDTQQDKETRLVKIYQDRQNTFFCHCAYAIEDSSFIADINSCSQQKPSFNLPDNQVEWSYIIPPEKFAQQLSCWNSPEQFETCKNSAVNKLEAIECCALMSEEFNTLTNNVHNLVPVLANINTLRKNRGYAQVSIPNNEVAVCSLKVDKVGKKFEPAKQVKGDIARIYLYFDSNGAIKITRREKRLFEIWDMIDPVDSSECEIQFRKAKIQGDSNPYIANRC